MGQRDILLRIVSILDKYHISYFLTGSLAVSYYGYPRATHDIDFVLEYKSGNTDDIIRALRELGDDYLVSLKSIRESLKQRSQFDIFHTETGIKIDFWCSKADMFAQNKFQRRLSIRINRKKVYICSAEDLIINKLLWCKDIRSEKHLSDCIGILKVQKGKLDSKYLDKWIRIFKLDELYKEIHHI